MISEYTQFDKLKEIVRQGTCSRTGWAGTRAGDCEHAIGLPGKHDGPDTEDIYGKPSGWCWSCWKSHQIEQLKTQVDKMSDALEWCSNSVDFGPNSLAHEGWQKLVKPLLKDNRSPKRTHFLGFGNSGQRFVDTFWRKQAGKALAALSGGLNHDNVARAKQILRKTLDLSSDKTLENEVQNEM